MSRFPRAGSGLLVPSLGRRYGYKARSSAELAVPAHPRPKIFTFVRLYGRYGDRLPLLAKAGVQEKMFRAEDRKFYVATENRTFLEMIWAGTVPTGGEMAEVMSEKCLVNRVPLTLLLLRDRTNWSSLYSPGEKTTGTMPQSILTCASGTDLSMPLHCHTHEGSMALLSEQVKHTWALRTLAVCE